MLESHWRNKLQVLTLCRLTTVWRYPQYLHMDIYVGSYNQSHPLSRLFMGEKDTKMSNDENMLVDWEFRSTAWHRQNDGKMMILNLR